MKKSNSEDVKHYLRHLVGAAYYNGNTSLETCGALLSRIERAIDERDELLAALKMVTTGNVEDFLLNQNSLHELVARCEAKP